ncbi:MltA domain protein [Methylocella silvestris BL2]|uniref:peptidoglycan lytic exotransglycosylase n=1 Tax=Methylocella silvestris (strain DSM 15510 / CIP 108128 / LMG 27833 / NCIMB 13906 / BL2) TaxID=395965 RepID=B8ENI1_METSB|nr:MltA domain-containing protein [Methylocella silvestris]ACK50112.1 MltA domain protein [Methylocella silvestris BL2]
MVAALRLESLAFSDLPGFADDDHAAAFAAFRQTAAAIVAGRPPLRQAAPPSPALISICRRALDEPCGVSAPAARRFFESSFRPVRGAAQAGFFTGYYEPVVDGSLTRSADFAAPILSRPNSPADTKLPDRAAILSGAIDHLCQPIVWLKDAVEVFLIQVQGSARVRLADGCLLRLVYAGRNGWPYRSIGAILIESRAIAPDAMSLAALKGWIRAHGQRQGEAGAELMARNPSYVFFEADATLDPAAGPIGGAGLPLTPLRSLAVDRSLYAYGTPVWIDVDLAASEGGRVRRLMIAQDTGSAILGPARADIFFGSGDEAGARAGNVRHAGEFVALLPARECAAAGARESAPR